MMEQLSIKQREAMEGLPNDLKSVFDKFVSDYIYATTLRYGRPYVSYIVLADMIRAGWRPIAEAIKEMKP